MASSVLHRKALNNMNRTFANDPLWSSLVEQFREACVLRRNGRHEESEQLLQTELPNKIAAWSKQPLAVGVDRRTVLENMFHEEQRRVEEAFFVQKLVAAQIEAWAALVGAVHKAGGRIALQLWHGGRVAADRSARPSDAQAGNARLAAAMAASASASPAVCRCPAEPPLAGLMMSIVAALAWAPPSMTAPKYSISSPAVTVMVESINYHDN